MNEGGKVKQKEREIEGGGWRGPRVGSWKKETTGNKKGVLEKEQYLEEEKLELFSALRETTLI